LKNGWIVLNAAAEVSGGIEKKVGRPPPSLQSGCNAKAKASHAKTRRCEGDHFPKIPAGSLFLGLRWLDTALDFPIGALDPIQSSVKPEHSRTSSFPENVLGNCGTLSPTFRAFASPREIPDPSFLDCGGLTPLWISPALRFPHRPSSHQPPPKDTLGSSWTAVA
jgi:hypothetical protein